MWLPVAYTRSVEAAGGLPLLISPLGATARRFLWPGLQGLIFPGGDDISPLYFGQEPLPGLGEVDPGRDDLEIYLAREALRRDLPVLGICRGIQILNVAAGGTVIQDLGPGIIQHDQKSPRCYPSHLVAIEAGSCLSSIIGEEVLPVNSFHHQAVGKIAPGFIEVARATDGVVEAMESCGHRFALGLQWHPESLFHPSSAAIFRALVKAAGQAP